LNYKNTVRNVTIEKNALEGKKTVHHPSTSATEYKLENALQYMARHTISIIPAEVAAGTKAEAVDAKRANRARIRAIIMVVVIISRIGEYKFVEKTTTGDDLNCTERYGTNNSVMEKDRVQR
jgi:hypothetical protein